MARPSTSALRSLVASSSRTRLALPTRARTLASYAGAPPSDGALGATISVDSRVLEGVDGFLTRDNMDTICDWQRGLWRRLQDEVRNNPELLEVKQKWDKSGLDMTYMISQTAREQSTALAYNYGALLLNNSYFLETINPESRQEVPKDYEALEDKVAAYAEGIVGGCWLWLIRTGEHHTDLDIVPTFGSGTFLISNRAQRGREPLPVFGTPYSSESTDGTSRPDQSSSTRRTGFGGGVERSSNTDRMIQPRVGDLNSWPAPLAVLNLFEHAYLGQRYGVWSRAEYARDWWKSLDWQKVQHRFHQIK